MRIYLEEQAIPCISSKKPTFSSRRGRHWEKREVLIDEVVTSIYLDVVWGEYIYFQYKGGWRKVRMQSSNLDDLKGNKWDIDPFSAEITKLTTNK